MRRYNVFYYILFLAVILGAFASMAQNSYGMKLMGFACFGFFVIFLYELVFSVSKLEGLSKRDRTLLYVELSAMALLSLLFCFRSFLIEIPAGWEWVLFSLVTLLAITGFNALIHIRKSLAMHRFLGLGMFFYYGSILLFIITFMAGVVRPSVATLLGPIGFIFVVGFNVVMLTFKGRVVEGEKISPIRYLRSMNNKSGILLIGFLLMFLFFGMNKANIFPPLYSGEMPSGYLYLLRQAESGEEKTDGKKRYELFDEQYQKFLKNLKQK